MRTGYASELFRDRSTTMKRGSMSLTRQNLRLTVHVATSRDRRLLLTLLSSSLSLSSSPLCSELVPPSPSGGLNTFPLRVDPCGSSPGRASKRSSFSLLVGGLAI